MQGEKGDRIQKILSILSKELRKIYRHRLKGLVVYGSFARGEERLPESDLDVAMVLDDFERPWVEIERTGELVSQLSLELGLTISLIPIRERDWKIPKSPLLLRMTKEGVMIK